MQIKFYNHENLHEIEAHKFKNGSAIKKYLSPIVLHGSGIYVKNSSCKVEIMAVNQLLIPITLPEKKKSSTYINSLLTQYLTYPLKEIHKNKKIGGSTKFFASIFIPVLTALFSLLNFKKVVLVNNWLCSGNMFPKLSKEEMAACTEALKKKYNRFAIVWRGIDDIIYSEQKSFFEQLSYLPLSGRLLYVLDHSTFKPNKKRPFQQDKKRWQEQNILTYQPLQLYTETEIDFVLTMYKELYISKHSELNPDYSPSFLKQLIDSNLMSAQTLVDSENKLKAVQMVWEHNGVLTTPFIGYDPGSEIKQDLYKHLSYLLINEALEKKLLLNMSSGAGTFKKQRGGTPSFEYNMSYLSHLPAYQKWPFQLLHYFNERFIKKNMLNFEV